MAETVRDPGPALELIRRAPRVFVTFHSSPDGDAVGSALGFAELVEAIGGAVTVWSRDPYPASLAFLPGLDRISVGESLPGDYPSAHDLCVLLECPGLDRPGFDGLERLPILNIDHHLANELYGAVNYVDEGAPAVGEMVLAMAHDAGVAVSPAMATNLYTALVTDTGDFRYSNATPRAFAAAAMLVAAGAEPAAIAESLYEHAPARAVRLMAAVLSTLELHAEGRLALITCDRTTLEGVGARQEDTEGLINYPRAIDGVRVVAFLKSFSDDVVRVSMRSRGRLDVQAVAQRFGGGGHRNASGCTLRGVLADARRVLLDILVPLVESA
jgi:bifunctional oligoribonuclease and PAP phosphatase NrnA